LAGRVDVGLASLGDFGGMVGQVDFREGQPLDIPGMITSFTHIDTRETGALIQFTRVMTKCIRRSTWPRPLFAFSLCSLSLTAVASDIGGVLQPFVDRHELAGAVTLVASKDKILSVEAVGYSDIANKKRMTTDAVFWIASMSKPIASTALMLLVDEGKVRLDDPVGKYLPAFDPRIMAASPDETEVLLRKPSHPITVRQLLDHRSGMKFKSSLESPTLDAFPLELRVKSYALEPLMSEPGAEFSYSNAGINTAAHIIEVVSGMPYEEFLQRRLFDPLGMTDTTFWPTDAQVARLAKSYKPNAAGTDLEETSISQLRYPLTDRNDRYPMPAGGLFSTAADLVKFCQMLLNGGTYSGKHILSETAIKEMTRWQSGPVDLGYGYTGYGLGFELKSSGAYGHPGAYSTNMTIDPVHGLITIWLVQHVGFAGNGGKSEAAFEEAAVDNFAN